MNLYIIYAWMNGESCEMIVEALNPQAALHQYDVDAFPLSEMDDDPKSKVKVYQIRPTGRAGVLEWASQNLKDVTP